MFRKWIGNTQTFWVVKKTHLDLTFLDLINFQFRSVFRDIIVDEGASFPENNWHESISKSQIGIESIFLEFHPEQNESQHKKSFSSKSIFLEMKNQGRAQELPKKSDVLIIGEDLSEDKPTDDDILDVFRRVYDVESVEEDSDAISEGIRPLFYI